MPARRKNEPEDLGAIVDTRVTDPYMLPKQGDSSPTTFGSVADPIVLAARVEKEVAAIMNRQPRKGWKWLPAEITKHYQDAGEYTDLDVWEERTIKGKLIRIIKTSDMRDSWKEDDSGVWVRTERRERKFKKGDPRANTTSGRRHRGPYYPWALPRASNIITQGGFHPSRTLTPYRRIRK